VPAVVPAWVHYVARRTGVSEASVSETLSGVEPFIGEFADAYNDPDRWGAARAVVASLLADIDPESDDADDVFARRMFAVSDLPGPDFDPDDEESFATAAIHEHPEYTKVFDDPSADPTIDGVNVRLHVALHGAVARQLWFGDPPEVWTTAQRLLDSDYDRHDIFHALMYALSTQIHGALTESADRKTYETALEALPGSWEETFDDPDRGDA
jgi:uncharacterized protein DUF1841